MMMMMDMNMKCIAYLLSVAERVVLLSLQQQSVSQSVSR